MGISCNRVAVIDGHTETLYAEFADEITPKDAVKVAREVRGRAAEAQAAHGAGEADNSQDGERQAAAAGSTGWRGASPA